MRSSLRASARALALLLFGGAPFAHSAPFYLNPGSAGAGWGAGSDFNNGTAITSPWKTVDKVRNTVGPGAVINVKGGTYTYAQYQIESGTPAWTAAQAKGAAGNPIVFQPYDSTPVIWNGENAHAYWMSFTGDADFYVLVQGMTFRNYAGVAIAVSGATGFARRVVVQDCIFKDFYDNQTGPLVAGPARYVIYRRNTITNSGDLSLGGQGLGNSQQGIYLSDNDEFTVIDQNYIEKVSGYGIHLFQHNPGNVSRHIVLRRNTVVNSHAQNIIVGQQSYIGTYVYNNTLYNETNPFPVWDSFYGYAGAKGNLQFRYGGYQNTYVLNNIGYGYAAAAANEGPSYVDVYANFTAGVIYDYNLFANQTAPAVSYKWNATSYTLAALKATFPPHQAHGKEANPLFTNPAAGTRDFTLQTSPVLSPAIDTGTTLTTTTTACSANSVPLTEAGFFHDGYGVVEGDTVQIGTVTRVLTGVDYTTNTITWAGAALTCPSGTPVSLPYNGSAPDMGAWESGTATPVATQLAFTTQPVSGAPGATLAPLVVEVRKADNTVDTTSTAAVTLAVSGGPGFFTGALAGESQVFLTPKTGRYVKLVTAKDLTAINSVSAAEIVVFNNSLPLAQSGLSVVSVSSEETSACCGGPHLATQALDGTPATFWYSQYTPSKPGHPYTLILDLGATYAVNGWSYLPQQLDTDGRLTQYTFWVSVDGTTWGTALTDPRLTGTLTKNAVAGVATFSDIRFDTQARDYQLTASAVGLIPAVSSLFDVLVVCPPSGIAVRRVPH